MNGCSYQITKNTIPFFSHTHTGYGGNLFEGLKIPFEKGATHVDEIHGAALERVLQHKCREHAESERVRARASRTNGPET